MSEEMNEKEAMEYIRLSEEQPMDIHAKREFSKGFLAGLASARAEARPLVEALDRWQKAYDGNIDNPKDFIVGCREANQHLKQAFEAYRQATDKGAASEGGKV